MHRQQTGDNTRQRHQRQGHVHQACCDWLPDSGVQGLFTAYCPFTSIWGGYRFGVKNYLCPCSASILPPTVLSSGLFYNGPPPPLFESLQPPIGAMPSGGVAETLHCCCRHSCMTSCETCLYGIITMSMQIEIQQDQRDK